MSTIQNPSGVLSSSAQKAQHVVATQPPPALQRNNPASNSTAPLVSPKANTPPFTAYLQIVSFTATITISVSISASQGFAMGDSFFGTAFSDNDDSATAAIRKTISSANWLSWSAAVSSLSLMITLVLQLLLTDEFFVHHMTKEKEVFWKNIPRMIVSVGSWIALLLQGSSLALIGQALKIINPASGTVIQWCLLTVGLPSSLLYILILYKDRLQSNTT